MSVGVTKLDLAADEACEAGRQSRHYVVLSLPTFWIQTPPRNPNTDLRLTDELYGERASFKLTMRQLLCPMTKVCRPVHSPT